MTTRRRSLHIVSLLIILFSLQSHAEITTYEWSLLKGIPFFDALLSHLPQEPLIAPAHPTPTLTDHSSATADNPLFRAYPQLCTSLPRIQLGDLPTPLIHCTHIEQLFPQVNLYIKHDGLCGTTDQRGMHQIGGNKLRKLQYLLADARAHGHTTVITFGCAGSNHATQTAVCAKTLGLRCVCFLLPQLNAYIVRRNLLLQHLFEAEMCLCKDKYARARAAAEFCFTERVRTGSMPYIIPTGGSTPVGIIGYVEAAYELAEQIARGLMPVLQHLYVACGSDGTTAGLLLGIKALGLPIKVHAVLTEPRDPAQVHEHIVRLCTDANKLLISGDAQFPPCEITRDDYEIVADYTGNTYGKLTPEGSEAIQYMYQHERVVLDGVYSGKCASALLADLRSGKLDHSTVLFWDTFYGEPVDHIVAGVDYHRLAPEFHRWFEEPVQEERI